ncbi:MAG: 50S ribosomal protein L9 [Elusimicrobia bacterium CG08_land_8_20_14_0_20_51_18]|nr:MAG: 50S ribosomal protein L9 [Elusimicrobia bacterium CG08_land_8_20_14_0_20_51_18]
MKVILKKSLRNLGKMGDVKQVKDGYARNYLLPRGIAEPATEGAVSAWKSAQEKRKKKFEQENKALQLVADKISQVTLSFSRAVSPEGVMFGSVAKSDILKALKAADVQIDKEMIVLPASIKAVGAFEIEIILNVDITAKVKVNVTAQNS